MSEEIRFKIAQLNDELDSILDPSSFVLNPRVNEIFAEIAELQEECEHNFVNGECEFCGMYEED